MGGIDGAGLIALGAAAGLVLVAASVLVGRLARTGARGRRRRAGTPTGVLRLEFIGGPLSGQVVVLEAEVTTIGSVAGNTIVVADPAVSRHHVEIRHGDEALEVADLGSKNGIYVNGRRAARAPIAAGDIVRAGNTEFVLRD
jgi:hypothetical protein